MHKLCKRCASNAARLSQQTESGETPKRMVRDVLAEMRSNRSTDPIRASEGLKIKDFVRASSSKFVSELKQLTDDELIQISNHRRVRDRFTGSTLERFREAKSLKASSDLVTAAKAKQSQAPETQDFSQAGQGEVGESTGPLRLYPGDLVEFWPTHSARMTAIVLRRPSSASPKNYMIISDRGRIERVNPSKIKFVIHDFYDISKIPQDMALLERDASFQPIRAVLKQFKEAVNQVSTSEFAKLTNLYGNLPKELRDGSEAISSRAICEIVFGDATQAQLYATCVAILRDRKHFLPDLVQHMNVPMFFVRPRRQIKMIERVTSWTRSETIEFKSFLSRARSIIAHGESITSAMSGELTGIDSPVKFTESDQYFIAYMRQACLEREESVETEIFSSVLAKIVKGLKLRQTDKADRRAAFEALKRMGILVPWEVNVDSIDSVGLPGYRSPVADRWADYEASNFDHTRVESLERLGMRDCIESLRHDFGQLPVYTIDGENAAELDDGISIDGDWVHVHIANPAAFIPYGTKLAEMAEYRGQTFYLGNRTYPMLPKPLVMKHFSLGALARQCVMTTSIRLGQNGEVLERKVRAAVVHNIKRFTYESVDEHVFRKANAPSDVRINEVNWQHGNEMHEIPRVRDVPTAQDRQDILQLAERLSRFRRYRIDHGLLDLSNDEKEIFLQPQVLPSSLVDSSTPRFYSGRPGIRQTMTAHSASKSRSLVQEAALLTNSTMARYAHEHKIPIIYRTYEYTFSEAEKKELLSLRNPDGHADYFSLGSFASRLPSGLSTLTIGPADTLGLPGGYTFSTSPLRRYADMVLQWQLQSYMLREPYKVDLNRVLPAVARKDTAWKRVGKSYIKNWTVQLLHQRMERGESMDFDVRVVSNNTSPQFPSEGFITALDQKCLILRNAADPILPPGTNLKVVVDSLDLMDLVIYVRPIDM